MLAAPCTLSKADNQAYLPIAFLMYMSVMKAE